MGDDHQDNENGEAKPVDGSRRSLEVVAVAHRFGPPKVAAKFHGILNAENAGFVKRALKYEPPVTMRRGEALEFVSAR